MTQASQQQLSNVADVTKEVVERFNKEGKDVSKFVFSSELRLTSRVRNAEEDEIRFQSYKMEGAKSTIPCPECRGVNVGYYIQQQGSGDEGQLTFFDCGDCGHLWHTTRRA